MLAYYIILIIILVNACVCKKIGKSEKKKLFLITSTIILAIFAGSRQPTVGTDTKNYIKIYEKIYGSDLPYYQSLEIGFRWIISLCHLVSDNSNFFLTICEVIIVGILGICIYKLSNNVYMSIALYITLGYYMYSFNTIRQCIAISFVCLGYCLILQYKKKTGIIMMAIAYLFHNSSIIGFLLLFQGQIDKKKSNYCIKSGRNKFISQDKKNNIKLLSKKQGLLVFGLGICTLFLALFFQVIIRIILNYFPKYLSFIDDTRKYNHYFSNGWIFIPFINISIWLFLVFGTSKDSMVKRQFLLPMSLAVLFSLLQLRAQIFSRFVWYFDIFSIFIIPNVIKENIFQNESKKIIKIIIFILCFVLYTYYIMHSYQATVPYQSVWKI